MINVRNRAVWLFAGLIVVMLCGSAPLMGQFDTGAILAFLQEMNQVLTETMVPPLQASAAFAKKAQEFQQQTMYPMQQINQWKSMASQLLPELASGMHQFGSPTNSASTPDVKALESMELGGQTSSIGSIQQQYAKVYGPLPPASAMSASVRAQVDMTDATSQASLKKAIELDAIANQEMQVAQQLMQKLSSTSPGTASMIAAQASAWNLQANAYSQSAMAQLLRVAAADNALSAGEIKTAAAAHATISGIK